MREPSTRLRSRVRARSAGTTAAPSPVPRARPCWSGAPATETEPAVFHGLSAARPGARVRVVRADGTVAEFTVDDVRVLTRERFDARKAYGPRRDGRAELRLITRGGAYDRAAHAYTAHVVVSAYLTGAYPTDARPTGEDSGAAAGAPSRG